MTQTQLLQDLSQWLIESLFYLSIVFAFVYGFAYKWWESPTGKAMMTFHIGVVFVLLRSMLTLWGVPIAHITSGHAEQPTTLGLGFSWFTVIGLAATNTAVITLTWQSVSEIRYGPDLHYKKRIHKLMRLGVKTP